MPTNYLAGMVQPHQIMGQFGKIQTPFELEAQGMQVQSAKNKLLKDETQRNALADYAKTGQIESLRASPELYFKAMQAQQKAIPDMKITSVGVPGGMQRVMYDPRDPSQTMQTMGGTYQPPGFYEQGGGAPSGLPQQLPPSAPFGAVPPVQRPITQDIQPTKEAIPTAPAAPYGQLSPKDRAVMTMDDIKKSSASLEGMQKQKITDKSFIGDIDRFLLLNQEVETGKIAGSGIIAGIRGVTDPKLQEMESIANKLTPAMRQGMPGAASDRDVAMFASATVGLTKDREANKNVGLGLKVSRQNSIERANFMQEYFDKNQTLRGAEVKWAEYIESNPIFDPEAQEGSYDLNPNRQEYKSYFKGDWSPKTVRFGGKKYIFKDQKKYNAWIKATGQK